MEGYCRLFFSHRWIVTTRLGMGYTQKGGIDRVVLIATFAPRPQTDRTVETRMIGQGGRYGTKSNSMMGETFLCIPFTVT